MPENVQWFSAGKLQDCIRCPYDRQGELALPVSCLGEMDPPDFLGYPDSTFGKSCRSRYLLVVHPKIEASFLGNFGQSNFVTGGDHSRAPSYRTFLK